MALTRADVERTASLARLRLSEAELNSMTETLSKIFQYIDDLHEVDTGNVEPLDHLHAVSNVVRDDVPGECVPREVALKNAPDRSEECFRLPRVINRSE